jgi:hypothetical protein
MKESVPTTVCSAEIARPGRAARRVVRGAMLLIASTASLATLFLALRGFWDEAATTGFIAAIFMWQSWLRREPPIASLSRRLSHHTVERAAEDEEP